MTMLSSNLRPSRGNWFPPVTFQLRLRSLNSLFFVASNRSRSGFNKGHFRLTLHLLPHEEAFWNSSLIEWSSERQERLRWCDIELDGTNVHLGVRSIVIKVWFFPPGQEDCYLERTWGVYLSGLDCLGTSSPIQSCIPPNSLVFYMAGSYFLCLPEGCSAIKKQTRTLTSFDAAGDDGFHCLPVKSYNTSLLLRLHRMQRALHQRESLNKRLKHNLEARGVLGKEDIYNALFSSGDQANPPGRTRKSLRDQVFQTKRSKTSKLRMLEMDMKMKQETLTIHIELLTREIDRVKLDVESLKGDRENVSSSFSFIGSYLMEHVRVMSREKVSFQEWKEDFRRKSINGGIWAKALKEVRMNYVRNASVLYPIDCFDGCKIGTIRWVALPEAGQQLKDFASKNEIVVSVAVGWLAHLTHMISCWLDVPLRYPVRLHGSHSWIRDRTRSCESFEACEEFPLFVKGNSDWNKFEYAVLLLSKSIAQLRWYVRLNTKDLRPILRITSELLQRGKTDSQTDQMMATLPESRLATRPPPRLEKYSRRCETSPLSNSSSCASPSTPTSLPDSRRNSEFEVGIEAKEQILNVYSAKLNSLTRVLTPESDETDNCQNDQQTAEETAANLTKVLKNVSEEGRAGDTFWRDAASQSLALLSNPSNFQQSRGASNVKF